MFCHLQCMLRQDRYFYFSASFEARGQQWGMLWYLCLWDTVIFKTSYLGICLNKYMPISIWACRISRHNAVHKGHKNLNLLAEFDKDKWKLCIFFVLLLSYCIRLKYLRVNLKQNHLHSKHIKLCLYPLACDLLTVSSQWISSQNESQGLLVKSTCSCWHLWGLAFSCTM